MTGAIPISSKENYYRLIALWVICEALLGGIIHGLKIPVSGLVVGSAAVICISLIAWYVPKKGAILKATLIVAIFKMMLSPQAPLPAYIAVFFQGFLGEILFVNRRYFKLSCIVLAFLALLESGLQRILVLTLIYGNDLWLVINNFLNGLTRQKQLTNYSFLIGGIYVFIHAFTGVIVGFFSAALPFRINQWINDPGYNQLFVDNARGLDLPAKRKKNFKKGLLIIWLVLTGLYIQSYYRLGEPLLPAGTVLNIILRSAIIVFAWIFLISPFLRFLLNHWLKDRQKRLQADIRAVLELLPSVQQSFKQSWQSTKSTGAFKRLKTFIKKVLVASLSPVQKHALKKLNLSAAGDIYVLTGPVGSGKTTCLLNWAKTRQDVKGILSPVVNGRRKFMDLTNGEFFEMETQNGEDVLAIGRYLFSRSSFAKAEEVIESALDFRGWLIVDEIGPLEIRKQGLYGVMKKIIELRKGKTIIVIRDKDDTLNKIIATFSPVKSSATIFADQGS